MNSGNVKNAANTTSTIRSQRTVFVQGSFDLFHFGHLRLLEECAKLGALLIVGINTDELYRDYKDKEPVIPFQYRERIIAAIRYVHKTCPICRFSPLYWLKRNKPDVYVICEEWKDTKQKEIAFMRSIKKKVVVLPYLNPVSSTEIKRQIAENYIKHNAQYCAECHKKL